LSQGQYPHSLAANDSFLFGGIVRFQDRNQCSQKAFDAGKWRNEATDTTNLFHCLSKISKDCPENPLSIYRRISELLGLSTLNGLWSLLWGFVAYELARKWSKSPARFCFSRDRDWTADTGMEWVHYGLFGKWEHPRYLSDRMNIPHRL
jgi:hypothetical protein